MIALKILLFIILAVLGIILLVLVMPVSASFSFIDGKVRYKVKYSLFNIIDSDGGGLAGRLLAKNKKTAPEKKTQGKKSAEDKPEPENPHEAAEKSKESDTSVKTSAEKVTAETVTQETAAENTSENDCGQSVSDDGTETVSPKKKKKSLEEVLELISDIWQSAKRRIRKIFKGFHFSDIYIDFLVADEDAYKCAVNYGRICAVVYNGLAFIARVFTAKMKTIDVECGFAQEKSRWDAAVKVWFIPMTAVIAGLWFLITYIFRIYLPAKIKNKKSAKKQKAQPQGGM